MVWAPRLHGEPGGPTSITGTARFVPATFYIASLPFQDALQIGGSFARLPPAPTTFCYRYLSVRRRLPSLTAAGRWAMSQASLMGFRRLPGGAAQGLVPLPPWPEAASTRSRPQADSGTFWLPQD